MKKNVFIIILLFFTLFFLGVSIFLFLEKNKLENAVDQERKIYGLLESELKRIKNDKDSAEKLNEKIKEESLTYLEVNNDLQGEVNEFTKKIAGLEKLVKEKNDEAAELTKNMEEKVLQYKKGMLGTSERKKLKGEIEGLEKDNLELKQTAKKQTAIFYYNLGVAYTKAKLHDKAIEAYEKSLDIMPENAEAEYNQAVIYQNYKNNSDKAIIHYRNYLQINPQAEDRQKIELRIKELTFANI